jgi:hypothetical protein
LERYIKKRFGVSRVVREIGPPFVKLIETSEAPLSFNNASLVKKRQLG